MKWFKHDCDMYNDLKVQILVNRHGLIGYAIWNLCLEIVGRNSTDGRVYGKLFWKQAVKKMSLISKDKKLDEILDTMAEVGLICKKALKHNTLYVPKFAERIDEYSRKKVRTMSGQCQDFVPLDKEEDKEKEKNKILMKGGTSPPNPLLKKVIEHICTTWQNRPGNKDKMKYPFNGKHAKLIQWQCNRYEPAGVMALWDLYMKLEDPFVVNAGFSIEVFVTVLPRLADMGWKSLKQKYEEQSGLKSAGEILKGVGL